MTETTNLKHVDGGARIDGGTLAGKVALVTGSNRGLGREIAIAMALAGANIALAARRVESLDETRICVERLGRLAMCFECDVADEVSVSRMANATLESFGRVDIVVANAGVAGPTQLMHEIRYQNWRECLTTNLDGIFLTFRDFIPRMIEAHEGCLIAISSMTGKRPLLGRTPYAAAKMGAIGLVRTLALELGPYGVRVNCVCPGPVEGPRIREVIARQAAQQGVSEVDAARQFISTSALGRFVEPSEVASTCVFLASPAASAITGEDLNVSAGLVMY